MPLWCSLTPTCPSRVPLSGSSTQNDAPVPAVAASTLAASDIRAALHHTVPPVSASVTPTFSRKMTRTNYFLDFSMNLLLAKLVGEVGQVTGGKMATYNVFDTAADASRMYGSVGVRLGF